MIFENKLLWSKTEDNNGCEKDKEQAVAESGTVTHKTEHVMNVRVSY